MSSDTFVHVYLPQKKRGFILPYDAEERLGRFVYRSSDDSLIYSYITKPMLSKLINFVPVWLAPNTITLMAFSFTVLTHIIMAYFLPSGAPPCLVSQVHSGIIPPHCPTLTNEQIGLLTGTIAPPQATLQGEFIRFLPLPVEGLDAGVPSFIFLFTGLSFLIYNILDNLDGQQARRLGLSSTLGMLFDHGLDAFNCMVGALSFASCLATGVQLWKFWAINLSVCSVFFFATWESFYRGGLFLPLVNGPNEGILISIAIYIITTFMGGSSVWLRVVMINTNAFTPGFLQPVTAQLLDLFGVSALETGTGILAFHLNAIPLIINLVGTVYMCIDNVRQTFLVTRQEALSHPDQKTDGSEPIYPATLRDLLRTLQHPITVIVCTTLWFAVPWHSTPEVASFSLLYIFPRGCVWIMGLYLTRMSLCVLLAHQLHEQYSLIFFEWFEMIGFTLHCVLFAKSPNPSNSEDITWIEVFVYYSIFRNVISIMGEAIMLTHDMGMKLGIPFFTVPHETQKRFIESQTKRD